CACCGLGRTSLYGSRRAPPWCSMYAARSTPAETCSRSISRAGRRVIRPARSATSSHGVSSAAIRAGIGYQEAEAISVTRAATIADVDVNTDTGVVRVRKVVVAASCGRIINPQGMRYQLQGALLQGLSRSLFEEVKFQNSRVTNVDWRSYPILTFPDVPEV